jgi:hypothetical protein
MEGVMKDVRGRVSRDAVDRNGSDGRAGKRIKLHHDESESLLNDASSKAVVSASKLKTAQHQLHHRQVPMIYQLVRAYCKRWSITPRLLRSWLLLVE